MRLSPEAIALREGAAIETQWERIAVRALEWARARDYAGYSKHDALNSPVIERFAFDNKWLRIAATQAVMRSPLNLRPWLGVRPARNAKGIALFARAWLNLFALDGDERAAAEARSLLDWLVDNPSSSRFPGHSWGYPYPWQDLGFFAPRGFPNRIVTYFVGQALVDGYEALGDPRYLEAAAEAVRFVLEAPKVLEDGPALKCLSYVPVPDISMAVMDVSCLCGVLVARVGNLTGDARLMDEASKLVAWVVDKQTSEGAWWYTHPPSDSHISHDNYHTGEIVDSLLEYERASGDAGFRAAYESGLAYYRSQLFTEDWRPKWMNDRRYPYDIHGYSQGIISFTLAGDLETAERIANAAIEDMWDEREGRFFYQTRKYRTTRYTLMRWCQAWMSFALSSLARARKAPDAA